MSNWIRVKDSLPQIDDIDDENNFIDVIVYDGQFVFSACYGWGKFFYHDIDGFGMKINPLDDITHWMSMPEPPR